MIDKKELEKDIDYLRKKYIKEYDPRDYHFKVGDFAWILFDYIPTEVEIVEIQDFKEYTGSEDAYVFYWIHFADISELKWLWQKIRFRSWEYVLRFLKFKPPMIPLEFGPGHAVQAGVEIFETPEEALIDGLLYSILLDLDELEFVKKENKDEY